MAEHPSSRPPTWVTLLPSPKLTCRPSVPQACQVSPPANKGPQTTEAGWTSHASVAYVDTKPQTFYANFLFLIILSMSKVSIGEHCGVPSPQPRLITNSCHTLFWWTAPSARLPHMGNQRVNNTKSRNNIHNKSRNVITIRNAAEPDKRFDSLNYLR